MILSTSTCISPSSRQLTVIDVLTDHSLKAFETQILRIIVITFTPITHNITEAKKHKLLCTLSKKFNILFNSGRVIP